MASTHLSSYARFCVSFHLSQPAFVPRHEGYTAYLVRGLRSSQDFLVARHRQDSLGASQALRRARHSSEKGLKCKILLVYLC